MFLNTATHAHDEFCSEKKTQIIIKSAKLSGRNLTALLRSGVDIMVPSCCVIYIYFF